MVFALADYIKYRHRTGRFAPFFPASLMAHGWAHWLPAPVIDILKPGDLIFVQTLGCWRSWLIMYLTSSDVSHMALYIGNGEILHATTAGSTRAPVSDLFGDVRILPCRNPYGKSKDLPSDINWTQYEGRPYGWRQVYRKGLNILTGRDTPCFRWRFFLDISICLLILDLPFMLILKYPVFILLLLPYLGVILANHVRWRTTPPSVWDIGKPSMTLLNLAQRRANFVFPPWPPKAR